MLSEPSEQLEAIYKSQHISKLDYSYALFLSKFTDKYKELVQMTSALISFKLNQGHTCVYMKDFAEDGGRQLPGSSTIFSFHALDEWVEKLKKANILGDENDNKPLILDKEGRLFFQKFYKYEKELAQKLLEKANSTKRINDRTVEALNKLFDGSSGTIDYQKLAALTALLKNICIISGGAGTGKTLTACRILALILVENPSSKIALAAPTGKAANRLLESLKDKAKDIKKTLGDLLTAEFPEDSFTIHRLLGASESKPSFYYGKDRPVPYDVVIIDEVSMIDLALMVNIFRAIRSDTVVILLGDKNQLTSVEAGSVLGEICGIGEMNKFSPKMTDLLEQYMGINLSALKDAGVYKLQDCMVELTKNYRQIGGSRISELAEAVNKGNSEEALKIIKSSNDTILLPISNEIKVPDEVNSLIDIYFRPLLDEGITIDEAFSLLKQFKILTPYKIGNFSVDFINKYVEAYLRSMGHLTSHDLWYSGRPILIHKNDYNVNLFNGDIGIYLKEKGEGFATHKSPPDHPNLAPQGFVYFEGKGKTYRSLFPTLLPIHETAYAMTVHKAQGSEFDEVLLILGNRMHKELLNKQLFYTAVTRAKKKLYIYGDEGLIEYAILHPIKRYSALGDHLKTE